MNLPNIRRALADYHGPPLTFMEICGTHTAAISENGIPAILSPHIHLISGRAARCASAYQPILTGCATWQWNRYVCVHLWRSAAGAGSTGRWSSAWLWAGGCKWSILRWKCCLLPRRNRAPVCVCRRGIWDHRPVYAVLADTIMKEQIPNVQLLTALKTMPRQCVPYAKAKRRLTVSWRPAMWR